MSAPADDALAAVLNALEEPALVVRRGRVVRANDRARDVLGAIRDGSDVRLAIRHPQVLELVVPGSAGEVDVTGLGEFGRTWSVKVSGLGSDTVLVRLIDRSEAQAAERMRVDFVANASHELRTPLATIIGYAETLADDGPLDESVRIKFSKVVESEAKRMLRIVEDLMSLSRIVAERFVPPTLRADLAEVFETARANLAAGFDLADFQLDVDVPADLPPVQGDFAQLVQVVENLLSNALRYSGAGSAIHVSASESGNQVKLVVDDNGPGIAREHLPRLTERFYRVDAARSRESGGTGLGLAIVKHIVERHKGTLRIDSVPGQGTSVSISLPAARGPAVTKT